jgi:hypothetical protein
MQMSSPSATAFAQVKYTSYKLIFTHLPEIGIASPSITAASAVLCSVFCCRWLRTAASPKPVSDVTGDAAA